MLIDSHCHINFPELADQAELLLAQMRQNHVTHALCVAVDLPELPSVLEMAERYPNTSEVILDQTRALQDAVKKAGIPVEIHAAAEYFMDEQFTDLLDHGELLTLDRDRHVLVEMSFHHEPLALRQALFDLQAHDYQPILAHPERYPYYHQKLDDYKALLKAGCKFQVNILSITGHYGLDVQQAAQMLLKNGLVSFLGTDAHRLRHAQTLSAALRSGHLEKTLQQSFYNEKLVTASA